ncbi:MAG: lactate utilization protein [Candidatus Bipolaricaulota bacterium]|nr:lactate utilization protein [Candidatus Bipolaricaulota bacterium]MDW8031785.1 lactate utilization protein [Candidatus Bipolaricaulota bacterium]
MSDCVERFIDELEHVAGKAQRARSEENALELILEILRSHQARTVALAEFSLAQRLERLLRERGYELVKGREIARAEVGISGAELAIAETGSLLIGHDGISELVAALPPVHIALIRSEQICGTLDEAFAFCHKELERAPRDFVFVTGPSRTADIELTPVIGVHGPQELFVIVL